MNIRLLTTAITCVAALTLGAEARADQADDALTILKSMSDYVVSQKSISVSFNTDIEVVTSQLQKIQFSASGTADLTRPDKFHAKRTGGYSDVEAFFDGKTLIIENRRNNDYAQFPFVGPFDSMVEKVRAETGADLPGADLLSANPFALLSEDVIEAKHIGEGVINGVECEHLTFRNADTDWQIWIDKGPKPIPRKLVITSKTAAEAPQYTLLINEWKSDVTVSPATFEFHAADGAKKIEFTELGDIDEVPPGQAPGGKP